MERERKRKEEEERRRKLEEEERRRWVAIHWIAAQACVTRMFLLHVKACRTWSPSVAWGAGEKETWRRNEKKTRTGRGRQKACSEWKLDRNCVLEKASQQIHFLFYRRSWDSKKRQSINRGQSAARYMFHLWHSRVYSDEISTLTWLTLKLYS